MSHILPDLFFFAGEQSGDVYGSHLLQKLKERRPGWRIGGVGGSLMRQGGMELFLPMEEFQVMGFGEIICSLPKLWRQFRQVRDHLLQTQPRAVILIDYPGFNLRLAASLRKGGYKGKIVQFICPSVWAWGKGRIPRMVDNLDLLLTIFPFESSYFAGTRLPVKYIGHPLVEAVRGYQYREDWRQKLGIADTEALMGLFPGSRLSELRLNLDHQLETALQFKKHCPSAHFGLSCSQARYRPLLQHMLESYGRELAGCTTIVPPECSYELMRDCHTAMAVSGTVTLELALHHKPTLVHYHVTPFNRLIAQHILRLRLPHYCIVNILAGTRLFPELMEIPYSKKAAVRHLVALHEDPQLRKHCQSACQQLTDQLYCGDAMEYAAREIEGIIS